MTSLCFGGADLRDLYVVSADNAADPARGGSIFRTHSDVAGLPAPFAPVLTRRVGLCDCCAFAFDVLVLVGQATPLLDEVLNPLARG